MQRSPTRCWGFTLVELLVVIAIIGILMAMILPAVQSSREAGRRTQCLNNIRNLAHASMQHLQQQGSIPSSGWGYGWLGDPDRGFGRRQPGGWIYSSLSYLEETSLHDNGKGRTDADKSKIAKARSAIPLAVLTCPTRNRPPTRPFKMAGYYNLSPGDQPIDVATTDYAGSGGSQGYTGNKGPDTSYLTKTDSQVEAYYAGGAMLRDNGATFTRSEIRAAHLRDGASKTYLLGERYLHFAYYDANVPGGDDDQSWDSGYDPDVNRWTNGGPNFDQDASSGVSGQVFGSAHATTFGMAFCDGSVKSIPYDIDVQNHFSLGARNDGGKDDLSALP